MGDGAVARKLSITNKGEPPNKTDELANVSHNGDDFIYDPKTGPTFVFGKRTRQGKWELYAHQNGQVTHLNTDRKH